MRRLFLFLFLLVFWCLLSGETVDPLDAHHPVNVQLAIAAVISAVISFGVSARMGVLDVEGQPIRSLGRFITYVPWLAIEIIKANVHVASIVWNPALPVAPRFVEVPHELETAVGRVVYANSITLTPGTVTIRMGRRWVLVHALTEQAELSLLDGEMERQVRRIDEVTEHDPDR